MPFKAQNIFIGKKHIGSDRYCPICNESVKWQEICLRIRQAPWPDKSISWHKHRRYKLEEVYLHIKCAERLPNIMELVVVEKCSEKV